MDEDAELRNDLFISYKRNGASSLTNFPDKDDGNSSLFFSFRKFPSEMLTHFFLQSYRLWNFAM